MARVQRRGAVLLSLAALFSGSCQRTTEPRARRPSLLEEPSRSPAEALNAADPKAGKDIAAPAEPVIASQPELGCAIDGAQEPRSARGLSIPAKPAKRRFEFAGRLRSHIDGPLSANGTRVWVGPPVPSFVPLARGTLELFVLDPVPSGHFALYRDPYDASSCKLSGSKNCAFEVELFDCSGASRFRVSLNRALSRPDRLEVQDARFSDNTVYFNEACQSYSREAKGKCSSLVALDPFANKVIWRTPPLTSNNRILVLERYIVTGYGFTDEPDFLFVVRRSDGKVMHRQNLPSAHEDLFDHQGALIVQIDTNQALVYRRDGFDGASPSLAPITSLVRDRQP